MSDYGYLPIFYDFPENTEELTNEEVGKLVNAMVLYARGDDPAPFLEDKNVRLVFTAAFKEAIDRDKELREKKKKAIESRWNTQRYKAIQKDTNNNQNQNQNQNQNLFNQNQNREAKKKDGEHTGDTVQRTERLGTEKIL